MEIHHKDFGGNDHVSVGVTIPNDEDFYPERFNPDVFEIKTEID